MQVLLNVLVLIKVGKLFGDLAVRSLDCRLHDAALDQAEKTHANTRARARARAQGHTLAHARYTLPSRRRTGGGWSTRPLAATPPSRWGPPSV